MRDTPDTFYEREKMKRLVCDLLIKHGSGDVSSNLADGYYLDLEGFNSFIGELSVEILKIEKK